MNLGQGGRCYGLLLEFRKYVLYRLSGILLEDSLDLLKRSGLCLILKFAHMLVERRGEKVVHRGNSLSEFDV
jgi:hypothetical protein